MDLIPVRFAIPVVKVDKDKRLVRGVGTGEILDAQGEVVDYQTAKDVIQKTWPGNVREMHQPKAVGHATEVVFDDAEKQIVVESYVSKGAPDTWEKCLDGTLRMYSIGGKAKERRAEKMGDAIVHRLFLDRIDEISLVDNGACPTATFEIVKIADGKSVDVQPPEQDATAAEAAAILEAAQALTLRVTKFNAEAGAQASPVFQQLESAVRAVATDTPAAKRDISTEERDNAKESDFAGPDRSFPILKPEDVNAAARALGRAKGNRDEIKRNIIRIAHRKGTAYVAQLPEAWKTDEEKKAAAAGDVVKQDDLEPWDIDRALQIIGLLEGMIASEMFDASREGIAGEPEEQAIELAQVELLKQAIALVMEFLISEYEAQFEAEGVGGGEAETVAMSAAAKLRTIAATAVAKVGRRNNAKDQETIQKMHDASVMLGAACKSAEVAGEGKDKPADKPAEGAEKAVAAASPATSSRAIVSEDPVVKELRAAADSARDALKLAQTTLTEQQATVTAQAGTIATLQERVAKLEAQPMPGGPMSRATPVEKTLGGAGPTAPTISPEQLIAGIEHLAKSATTQAERDFYAEKLLGVQREFGLNVTNPMTAIRRPRE